jgi:adenylosuccinate synthase
MSNFVVIGCQFGDEGKGLVTDWLCSQSSKPAEVVRFTGGHQCGHTVVVDGKRHVFSSFGSGTLRGVPTYWSHFCTVNPIGFVNELMILQEKDIEPEIFIEGDCPVTTPYDVLNNKWDHEIKQHGSCGVGFGATMQREEDFYSLTFYDLFFPDILREKLKNINECYYEMTGVDVNIDSFLRCCNTMTKIDNIKMKVPTGIKEKIFEGAQGLMLDQHFGVFPNVTRSNTGTKNLVDAGWIKEEDEIYLVTRAYQTRHGNGFMTNENIPHNIKKNIHETNVENAYQGKFRRTLLDLSLLEYSINKDDFIRNSNNKRLIITCLDHIENEHRFTYKGDTVNCLNEDEFVSKISDILGIKTIYLSHSEDSKNIIQWKKQ